MTATPQPTDAPVAAVPETEAVQATDAPAASPSTANEPTQPAASATPAQKNTPEPPSPTPKPASALPSVSPNDIMASPDYGVQAFLWWREEVADRDLGLIKDAGFHWVKQLFSWQDIEGAGKGQFDWSKTDRIVEQAEKAGLKLIVRVSQDPDRPFWAGDAPQNAGDDTATLGAVFRADGR